MINRGASVLGEAPLGGRLMGGGAGKATDGPVSRLLNRPVAEAAARAIIRLGLPVTPNMVSFIAFLLAVAAAVSAAVWLNWVAAGILVQLSSIVDGVDGALARLTGRASRAGGFLDTMLDRYADIIVYGGVAYSALAAGAAPPEAILAALAVGLSGDLMVSYLHARGEKDAGVHPALVGPLDSIASRDVRLLIMAIMLVLGHPVFATAAPGILGHIYVAAKSPYIYRLLAAGERKA